MMPGLIPRTLSKGPFMLRTISLLLMLSLLLLLPLGGCSNVERRIDPEYDIGAAQLLVVPFQQKTTAPSVLRWHYESVPGNTLALAIRVQLPASCDGISLISDERVPELVFHTDSDQVPWHKIGREVGASHILTGRIEHLSFRDRRSIGMLQGRLRGYWNLFRVEDGQSVLRREFDIRMPENPESGRIYVSFETSENELLGAMLAALAQRVTSVLCGESIEKIN
jgi:hypothetical protein